jgi:hypothetical protein
MIATCVFVCVACVAYVFACIAWDDCTTRATRRANVRQRIMRDVHRARVERATMTRDERIACVTWDASSYRE